jgi:anaerobic selenocysteine-containing dehydrogenase
MANLPETSDPKVLSRRDLLRGAAVAGVAQSAAVLTGCAAEKSEHPLQPASPTFDFTQQSGALQADKVVDSACQFCNSLCRLKVHLKAGRVIDITGETADPVQAGEICVKGPMMAQLVYNRLRLTRPLKRVAGEKGSPDSRFEPVTWDEALNLIAKKLISIRDAGEARTIANKTSGRLPRGTGSLVARFFSMLGSPNDTDVGPVCNDAGGDALAWTFGLGNFTNGYGIDGSTGKEDLGSSKFFLFLGTNQAETHPVTFAHLLRSRAKTGAKLVVIDPRLTPTGEQADLWIAPKPHTDLALALAMLTHIVATNLYDASFVAKWVIGFDELKKHLAERNYSPEWAEGVTGVRAADIVQIAEGYAKSKPAAIFCNAGISHQMGAFDTYRVLAFLAAVTGNIGRPGGGCNFMHNTWPGGLNLPVIQGETPSRGDALPVGPDAFADAILTGKPYPLKAIITCGNPILGSANTHRVQHAFKQLEFYVYTGLFMEEAAYYADIILPACSGLEFEGVYMRRDDRAIRWQHQAVPRVGESKPDTEIWIDLAHAMAKVDAKHAPEYWTANFPEAWKDYRKLWATFLQNTPGAQGMTAERMEKRAEPLRWPCPTVDHPGVSTLYLDDPSWYRAAESLDPKNKGKRFLTPSGKVEIFTGDINAKLRTAGHAALPVFFTHPEVTGRHPTIEASGELITNPVNPGALTRKAKIGAMSTGEVHRQFPLMGMIGRPSVVHFAGVTQWTQIGKQLNGIRLVQIHPQAAAAVGIQNGDDIVVESPRGSITATALLWEGIRRDTIFVPNTFGPMQILAEDFHDPLYQPANLLTDDRYFDNLSGQQAYKCFACRVRKA